MQLPDHTRACSLLKCKPHGHAPDTYDWRGATSIWLIEKRANTRAAAELREGARGMEASRKLDGRWVKTCGVGGDAVEWHV